MIGNEELKNELSRIVATLPLDYIKCTLRDAISANFENKIIPLSGNLFVYSQTDWRNIGYILKMLGIIELKFDVANFDNTYVPLPRQEFMNWDAFFDMLKNTNICKVTDPRNQVPHQYLDKLKQILKSNADKIEHPESHGSLLKTSSFFVAKANLPTDILPKELQNLVGQKKEVIRDTTWRYN